MSEFKILAGQCEQEAIDLSNIFYPTLKNTQLIIRKVVQKKGQVISLRWRDKEQKFMGDNLLHEFIATTDNKQLIERLLKIDEQRLAFNASASIINNSVRRLEKSIEQIQQLNQYRTKINR